MERNDDWIEVHFEVVAKIIQVIQIDQEHYDTVVHRRHSEQGRGGLYELAEELTDEFQEQYGNHTWDGDFFDVIEDFLNEKLDLT